MLVQRTEQHIVSRQSEWYKLLENKCHIAKNIYNHGNYLIRQHYIHTGKWLRYNQLEKLVKSNEEYTDYWQLGLANSSQQILRQLDKNWKSFFSLNRQFITSDKGYRAKPKIPKYLNKRGLCEFALTTQQVKLKSDNLIHFPNSMNEFIIKPQFVNDKRFVKFNQCRIVPRNDRIIVEIVYTINIEALETPVYGIGSIDLGVDNFVTFVDNLGNKPIIINGKGLKSYNRYYNHLISSIKSELDSNKNSNKYSHLLYSITNKRHDKIKYFMHNASNYIIKYCSSNNINVIVIGKNLHWKNKCKIKDFVELPYNLFINILKYKCQESNIKLMVVGESYTSGTSFLDNEYPIKDNYKISRRRYRGLFKSNTGKLINADVNSAYQIMRKVFCDAIKPADIGLVLNPIRVNLKF